jgi:hypothetical protein
VLTLQPNFFRPPAQRSAAIDRAMELHPCWNGEACVVNSTTFSYQCAEGYVGPLCGVCDTANGFALFSQACRQCFTPVQSAVIVAVLGAALFAGLVYVALRPADSKRTHAAIALKIALSYLQVRCACAHVTPHTPATPSPVAVTCRRWAR